MPHSQHALSLGDIPNAEQLRKPINDLCQALKIQGSVRLMSEFTGGLTKTRVFLARVQANPADPRPSYLVFKTGPGHHLRDEAQRFQGFIKHARAHAAFAKLCDPKKTLDTLSDDDSIGAIAYEYAPTPLANNTCSSLTTLVEECVWGDESVDTAIQILKTVGAALASLYAAPGADFSYLIARYYLGRWTPDFRVSVERAVPTAGTCLLTLHRFEPDHFLREELSSEQSLRSG